MKQALKTLGFLCLAFTSLQAQEASSEDAVVDESAPAPAATSVLDEAVIPQAFPDARYQTTWSSNPFLRKTVVIAGPRVDWSQDWALSSMYKSESGKITISLQNKQTGEFKRVTSEDTDTEFRLIKANFNRNRTEASADIARGSETATVKYDDNLTSRPVTVNNTFKAPATQPGAVGNPNARPGQPGQPGQPVNVTQPGGVPGTIPPTAANRPMVPNNSPVASAPGTAQPAVTPPTMSRRRQLVPAPIVPTPQQ
ncbi:hypothetical protein EI77_03374 [Prosthecobacter fusiformis]|uniref:Uncharacterized protein n=1 Tax=Prosthecobacter fusiformis TaxID=48464 RepID=A0A4V3FEJ5_9BACT|nr:hypothetical protein [Prosthecobacter fusiformis]TDU67173.1 hypothetical protein EI77_03374 [Prosthecobacter fusiformis]